MGLDTWESIDLIDKRGKIHTIRFSLLEGIKMPIPLNSPRNYPFIKRAKIYIDIQYNKMMAAAEEGNDHGGYPLRYGFDRWWFNPNLVTDENPSAGLVRRDSFHGTWQECHAMIASIYASNLSMLTSEFIRLTMEDKTNKAGDGMMAGENQFDPLNATWEFNDLHPKAGVCMSFDRLRERYLKASENFGDSNRIDILAQSPVGDSNTPQYVSEYDIMNQ